MDVKLSDHFDYKRLFRFVLPSVAMAFFLSIYGVVDGIFVANLVGAKPFAAMNLVMPLIMILGTVGVMLGSGGSALVAKILGEKQNAKANAVFSLLIYTVIAAGIVLTFVGEWGLPYFAEWFGASGEFLDHCLLYGRIAMANTVFFILQIVFQFLMVTAEKPHFAFVLTVVSGVMNIVFDALFIMVFHWGLAGAAWATIIGEVIGGLFPLLYFTFSNSSLLRLGKPEKDLRCLIKAAGNGVSEFMTAVSMSLVNVVYNFQLLRLIGEAGVVAYGVILYVNFIFSSLYLGFAMGIAPVISYHYGAENHGELRNLLCKSLAIIAAAAIIMTAAAELSASGLAQIFVSADPALADMTGKAFAVYALSFLLIGFNIFGSSFFTALNNGAVSAVISFFRVLFFQGLCIVFLPMFFGVGGIWSSIVVAEVLSVSLTFGLLFGYRKRYRYAMIIDANKEEKEK